MKLMELYNLQELAVDARYATRAETALLAKNLQSLMPEYRFEVEKKKESPVDYIRVKGAERNAITGYFASIGLDELPPDPYQLSVSGQYRANILSYATTSEVIDQLAPGKTHTVPDDKKQAQEVVYTLVVAGVGDAGSISVGKKELTPVELGLATRSYTREELVVAAKAAVSNKLKNRPELVQICSELLDIAAAGGQGTITPELNSKLGSKARNQLSVDFGEILAPLMFATGGERIEFPAAGNFPLIDVIVGQNNYSVKSLTGSGTSFASIADLMDSYEGKLQKSGSKGSTKVEQLFKLFKGYHPSAGGKNVDKIIRGAAYVKTAEYVKLTQILGGEFSNYSELEALVSNLLTPVIDKHGRNKEAYGEFLNSVYPAMVAGGWEKPAGLPADGAYYMGKKTELKAEKTAGFPSFRAGPVRAAADILTYVLGVGTLNLVTRGSDAVQYEEMMTNIVNQSPAYLGRLDITGGGGIVAVKKPFSDLKFKFQYHAPSHIPGNNLPGFMIIMD
jgi:hypothetical protein